MIKRKGFTLIELLVVVAIIALLIAILLPSLARARELSKRARCGTQIRSIGNAGEMYSVDNKGSWMVPAHSTVNWIAPDTGQATVNGDGTLLIKWMGQSTAAAQSVMGNCRLERWADGTHPSITGAGQETSLASRDDHVTTKISTSRALYQLIRETRVDPKVFVCPSSDIDKPERVDYQTAATTFVKRSPEDIYDFRGYRNLSYGYQVPFGPGDQNRSRAGSNADSRLVVLADKGPFATRSNTRANTDGGTDKWTATARATTISNSGGTQGTFTAKFRVGTTTYTASLNNLIPDSPADRWRRGNSPNHGGRGNGEGQNVYAMDGSAKFEPRPCVGVDNDNIYLRQLGRLPELSGTYGPDNNAALGQPIFAPSVAVWRGDLRELLPGLEGVEAVPGSGRWLSGSTDSYLWP